MMRMWSIVGCATVLVLEGCGPISSVSPRIPEYSDREEMDEFRALASRLGLKFDGSERSAADAHALAIRSESVLFSRRLDSRTYFVQDIKHGLGRPNGIFAGDEKEHLAAARAYLDKLKVPRSEVGKETVLQESLQTAQRSPDGKVMLHPATKGRRFVDVSRQIDGLPVFSSHFRLSLNRDRSIGYLELHWPEIPQSALREAHRLAFRVKSGWQPPDVPYARVESLEAGIVHSPALSVLMDIHPAIRVIYAPTDKTVGMKPMIDYDRDGHPIPSPRQFDLPCRPAEERSARKHEHQTGK